jgi:PBSX family phage terminase large subunit
MRLSQVIAPSFYSVHNALKNNNYTHYYLKGGRGSTKSSFIAIEIVLGMMKDQTANTIALRKVKDTLKDSVYEQFVWAIELLGVKEYWDMKISPLSITYLPTGQKIIFRGADKPKKIKSIKFSKGYCRFIWFEELDEFTGIEEVRMINQSLMRGGETFTAFYSFNPPKSQNNWVNSEVVLTRDDRLVHHSTYLKVPKQWLGEQFFIEAEHLEKVKPTSYQHEYLGEVVGTGGQVFDNVSIRKISNEEIEDFDELRRGIDFGYAVDPFSYTVIHYDRKRKALYIFFEIYKVGLSNSQAIKLIKEENINNRLIICDSAEPKSIAEFKEHGLHVRGAKKGADSVEYGIKFLQDLEQIIIDDTRCPNTAREFLNYELERDSNGNFKAKFPDKNNHCLDSVRYSLNDDMNMTSDIIFT